MPLPANSTKIPFPGMTASASPPKCIALAFAAVFLVIVAYFAGGNISSGVREDRSNRWVVIAFTVIGLLLGLRPAYTDRLGFWTIDGDTTRWLGIALYLIGGAIRLWPVFILRFSGLVAIQRDHTLVTNGIYIVIRHPSYLGLSSTPSAGVSPFALPSASFSSPLSLRYSPPACVPNKPSSSPNSAANTNPTALAPPAASPASIRGSELQLRH